MAVAPAAMHCFAVSGVTVDELKALHNDWKASREKGKKPAKV